MQSGQNSYRKIRNSRQVRNLSKDVPLDKSSINKENSTQ